MLEENLFKAIEVRIKQRRDKLETELKGLNERFLYLKSFWV